MNKKFVIGFVLVILLAFGWYLSKRDTSEGQIVSTSEDIAIEDKKPEIDISNLPTEAINKFQQKLKTELGTELNEEILDFTVDIQNLKTEKLQQNVAKVVNSTLNCYEDHLCDFDMPDEGEYFDASEVPALKTIKRQLQIAVHHKLEIPSDDLLQAVQLPNDTIVELSIDLLLRDRNAPALDRLWTKIEGQEGASFGPVAKKILEKASANQELYYELLEAFIRSLESKDPFTTIEALEAFRGLKIDQSRFEELGRFLCPWRVRADHNWLAAKKNLEEIAKEQGLSFNPNTYCQ